MFKGLGLRPAEPGFHLEKTRQVSDPVIEGYEMLAEMELQSYNIIHDHLYSTYTGTRESSTDIVMEGLGDMVSSAAKFFKELIMKLGDFFKRTGVYMASLFMNFDKFISKYKDELLKSEKEYSLYGFEYTFGESVPKTNVMMKIVNEFNSELPEVTKLEKADLVRRRDEFLEEGKMDLLRGGILGRNTKIESDEFRSTLFQMFRNGQDVEREIRIDKSKLNHYIQGYSNLKKEFDKTKKERYELEKVYRALETFFARGPKVEYVGSSKKIRTQTVDISNGRFKADSNFMNNENSNKNLDVINYYYSFKWKQAQEIGTYSFQAYVERINAIKEAVKFYEKVIRGAIFASPVKEV